MRTSTDTRARHEASAGAEPGASTGPVVPVTVSVVIAAFDEARLPLLRRAVASAAAQTGSRLAGVEVVVAVDNNPALLATARELFPGAMVVLNDGERGASATRNSGARMASGEVLAFLDDDAEALPGWLDHLVAPLADPAVVGVGGRIDPDWATRRPRWFPMEFGWVVGATYTGLPELATPVRNVWSENMAVRAADFWGVGGFREGFGKVGGASRPEDTELCIRMAAVRGGTWWIEPQAGVRHHVPADRATPAFFWRRCRMEGRGKAALTGIAGAEDGLSAERDYTRHVLPRGVLRGLRESLAGRPSGLLRALAIVLGLTAAGMGYAEELVVRRRRRRRAYRI